MASRTIENYLKTLYLREQEEGAGADGFVAMGKLAGSMGVAPGTATAMVKVLADGGLVKYEPRAGVRLTTAGEQLALHVLRRHRLVELFLVQVVGLSWSEVHEEAEELEHVISDKLLSRIDALLGHPETDPHGDPIPSARGAMAPLPTTTLADCALGEAVRVARVKDQDAGFLRFAEEAGLAPGAEVTVVTRNAQADAVGLQTRAKGALTLSRAVAAKFLVRAG